MAGIANMTSDIYQTGAPKQVDEAKKVDHDVYSVNDLPAYAYSGQYGTAGWENTVYDGDKFVDGFGTTQSSWTDYWTLRERSAQLFKENLYAKGLIRRLITNEINTGLMPEACPDEQIIGLPEDALQDWTETVENRFSVWAKNPRVCDWLKRDTFGAIQQTARLEALICGDILVVLHQNQVTKLPSVELIDGQHIQNPLMSSAKIRVGHRIEHGVELDGAGRHVAFWVKQKDGTSKRLPAYGEKSGRRISWLVYGTEKRHSEVRGTPLLSVVLQSLKEVDRYRDASTRKAVVNSILAMFIKKNDDKPSTLPLTGGAVRKDKVALPSTGGGSREFDIQKHMPGMVLEELQTGEEPIAFGDNGTDVSFGTFEESIIQAVAWSQEVPPEILRLAFSNNYSASQAAINEFKIYLNKIWASFGEGFCSPVYTEWMLAETLTNKIKARSLLESWRNPRMYDIYGAWLMVDWYGSIKPSTDMLKQAKGSKMLVDEGWSTNARESRITTGTKFSKNIKRLKKENELKAEAMRPMLELRQEFSAPEESDMPEELPSNAAEALEAIEAAL